MLRALTEKLAKIIRDEGWNGVARRRFLKRLPVTVAKVNIGRGASSDSAVRILRIWGVFYPDKDSALLAQALSGEHLKPGAAVLDMCTGSGVLSIVAARLGCRDVTAVDVSRLALICTRLNALLHRAPVRTRLGDLFAAVGEGALFDAIVSNPPFFPSQTDEIPTRSGLANARAWRAGRDGRALINRVCAEAPTHLRPGGFLLLVQPSVCDVPASVEMLTAQGLDVSNVAGGVAFWGKPYELVVIRASRHLPDERTAPQSGSDGVAPADEVLQGQHAADAAATDLAPGDHAGEDPFAGSRERYQYRGWSGDG